MTSKINFPKTYKIQKIEKETPTIKTFYFNAPKFVHAKPGQFVMVWIPGVDEIPLSVSSVDQNSVSVTVKNIGEATSAFHRMQEGSFIGLRGPYGKGFDLSSAEKVLAVGGGVGIAPLLHLVKSNQCKDFTVILAAKTADEIYWKEKFESADAKAAVCTDDGSTGIKAFAPQAAEEELKKEKFDLVVGCGPEIMLKHLFNVAVTYNTDVQFSLERWMKCGMGICGQCAIDPTGWRVCKEGPVADTKQLKKLTELFNYRRDKAGKIVDL